ncbi:DUF6737 family protein [Prochlorococcus marinus]|uniref:DUF6737 family protein n=1 Tax=Prochlorococcus marinus TaxID=1219 RepID=UPI002FBEEB9B
MESETKPVISSFWSYKPKWCQPWSILLTGTLVLIIIYLITNSWIIRLLFVFLISIWWFLFLFLAPYIYSSSDNN